MAVEFIKSDCISSLGIPARGGDAEGGLQTGGSVLPSRARWGSLFSPPSIAQRRRGVKRPYTDSPNPRRTRGSSARTYIELETFYRFREAFQLFTVSPVCTGGLRGREALQARIQPPARLREG